MTTFTERHSLSTNLGFVGKIEAATVQAASEIWNEIEQPAPTPYETARLNLAKVILQNSKTYLNSFVQVVLSAGVIDNSTSDADLLLAVKDSFDEVTGVKNV